MPIIASLPKDQNGGTVQIVPGKAALAITRDTTISTSTLITLNAATSLIEVSAIGDNVFLLYGTGTASATAFDECVLSGMTRHYSVPFGVTAINVIDNGNGGTVVVIEK